MILSIPISNVKKKSINLNDLLNISFLRLSDSEKSFERCGENMSIKNVCVCAQLIFIFLQNLSGTLYLCILTEKFFYANPCDNYL